MVFELFVYGTLQQCPEVMQNSPKLWQSPQKRSLPVMPTAIFSLKDLNFLLTKFGGQAFALWHKILSRAT